MKTRLLITGLALATTVTFGQKSEIRKAERAVKSGKHSEALSHLKDAENTINNADKAMQAKYYALQGEAYAGSAGNDYAKAKLAADSYQKAFALDPKLRQEHENHLHNLRAAFINAAVSDQNAERYGSAAEKLLESYKLSEDPSDLYFAAGNFVNAKDYDNALKYYQILVDQGYTGQVTEYIATDKETGEIVPFESESVRNVAVKSGDFIKPTTRETESKKGDMLRNMTLILIQQDKKDKARELMKEARAENPKDMYLMRAEADMVYSMGDKKRYNELMNEIIASDPDNPEIYFNLGASSADLGETEKALQYYEKALELRPDYEGALINVAVIKLAQENEIVEQMNSLGNSRADNEKYDKLRKDRENLYRETLPYLEKASTINPNNKEVLRTMMNIYSQLGEDQKSKEMKQKMEAINQQ